MDNIYAPIIDLHQKLYDSLTSLESNDEETEKTYKELENIGISRETANEILQYGDRYFCRSHEPEEAEEDDEEEEEP